ncbi:hypothetical protein ABB37_03795 [Leptomonas pyrrhocoris]|uniref:Uncharacterized protein n=1 Tax=Leptomonas pyrrhocoris TaxID=157538 RepID=A0A0M9G369_LEPPY|nr:hypothetical protein ABB37_03795 [Leptomonas pyrrhocoris]KPA81425.1 hypothetical protein ABB37_03795 [Leptomonas pyrrhocoris]|eukprot:XP_015659864.1 hypothetical protein ABB37_03795 [Leptomonas pyrrhocoris]
MPPKGSRRVRVANAESGIPQKPLGEAALLSNNSDHEIPPPSKAPYNAGEPDSAARPQRRRRRPRSGPLSQLPIPTHNQLCPLRSPSLQADAEGEPRPSATVALSAFGPPQKSTAEIAEAQAELALTSSPAPTASPSISATASTSSPPSSSSVGGAAASVKDDATTTPPSRDAPQSIDLCPSSLASVDDSHGDNFASGPPSVLGCLAACFGWRLASYSSSEDGELQFALRRPYNSSVSATVRAPRGGFDLTARCVRTDAAPQVSVNEVAMRLEDCATFLYRMPGHTASEREQDASQQQPIASSSPPLPSRESSSRSAESPEVRAPPVLCQVGRALDIKHRAEKHARSYSPSPAPLSPSKEHRWQKAEPEDDTGEVAPLLQREGAPIRATPAAAANAEKVTEKLPRQKRDSLPPAERSLPLPSLPPSFLVSIGPATPTKEESAPSPVVDAPPPPPKWQRDQPCQKEEEDPDDVLLVSLWPNATGATAVGVGADATSPPPPRLPAPRPAAAKRSFPNAALVPTAGVPHGKGASSPSRSRRSNAGASAWPPGVTASGDATAVGRVGGGGYSPSSSYPPTTQRSVKGSFFMPYMLALANVNASPSSANSGSGGVLTAEGHDGNTSGPSRQLCTFCSLTGQSAESSRSWLAHTHAVSREFDEVPSSRPLPPFAEESALCRGNGESATQDGRGRHVVDTTADVAAAVRATLRQRWRHRSSLWSHMEESLRLAVGSGRLRGDALEAGVQALQASEEEQLQYDGGVLDDGGAQDVYDALVASARATTLCGFPAIPPRPMLPVSGTTVVEAQRRISEVESGETGKNGTSPPRYVVYPSGIPAADRILIDRTYTTRGSYVVASMPSSAVSGTGIAAQLPKSQEKMAEGAADSFARQRGPVSEPLPVLLANPQEDLHYHIYKRFLTKDMREALEAEGTLEIGTDGIGPADRDSTERGNALAGSTQSVRDDNGEDDDNGEELEAEKDTANCVPAVKGEASPVNAAGVVVPPSSADIDYVLRYRPAIQRIPMPDVESRYGL